MRILRNMKLLLLLLTLMALKLTLIKAGNFFIESTGTLPAKSASESILYCKSNVPFDTCEFAGPNKQFCSINVVKREMDVLKCPDSDLSFYTDYNDSTLCAVRLFPFESDDVGKWTCILKIQGNTPPALEEVYLNRNGTSGAANCYICFTSIITIAFITMLL